MKKFATLLSFSLLLQTSFILDVHAERTTHKPWLAMRARTSSPRSESRDKSVAVAMNRHMRRMTHPVKGDRIVDQAIHYKGTKYRFGGDSKSKGFDCSGLVRRIYNDLNLDKLPHSSAGLYKMGKPIHLNELRPGDLVFFKNTYRRGVSHVGVYAGDNRFIHAQNRRSGVTVTTLSEPYYQLHYAGARRLY